MNFCNQILIKYEQSWFLFLNFFIPTEFIIFSQFKRS